MYGSCRVLHGQKVRYFWLIKIDSYGRFVYAVTSVIPLIKSVGQLKRIFAGLVCLYVSKTIQEAMY